MLTAEQLAMATRVRNELRARQGKAPLAHPELMGAEPDQFTVRPPVSRPVAIAALFILKVSYGQLISLFDVGKSTVYDAIARYVPHTIRSMRGAGHGRPLLSHEHASLYFDKIKEAGPHSSAIELAARINQLCQSTDPTE